MTKGYTVHYEVANGRTACGVKPKTFMGKRAVTIDPRRVTCPKCEKACQLTPFVLMANEDRQ